MSFDLQHMVRENVKALRPYASARDEYVSDGSQKLFLDANENPFDNGVNRYPDPRQRELKRLLARQKGIREETILLGNGSDEVLDLLFRAFCEPKRDNILTLPPTYGMYKVLSGTNDVENREVWLTPDFQPDVPNIMKAADGNSKLLFLCSPNNPTGNSIDPGQIIRLLNNFKGLVVIDEAYIDFSGQPSWAGRVASLPNLVVTQTLSKAYGLAGIRLGIGIASEAVIAILNKVKPPYNVNGLTQARAIQGVRDTERLRTEVAAILRERSELSRMLGTLPFVEKVYPTDANFVLAKVDDADHRYRQLLDQGIVVRNRSGQARCGNTLRFTVGTPEENERLQRALKNLSN